LEDRGVDWKIILKWSSKTWYEEYELYAQDRDGLPAFVKTVMNLQVP
jgi:hypothetical protein